MSDRPRFATIEDVGKAIAALEAKVPSRWEVRSLILGSIVVANFDVPKEATAGAILLALVIPFLKALLVGRGS